MNEDIFNLGIKAIIKNSEGKILLLRVNLDQLQVKDKGAYWDIPGGRIHKGSTVEETLKREVEEETGITAIKSHKQTVRTSSPMNSHEILLITTT